MFTLTRWSLRTLAATAGIALATPSASAGPQAKVNPNPVVLPQPQPKGNPVIVVPPGPKVNPAGIPQPPKANPNPIRVMPQVNSFPGFPNYQANNPWTPGLNNPWGGQNLVNPRPVVNPFANPFNNPLNNPFNPFNNPLVNNNPFINNNPLVNNNPFLPNPFINNPLNPFAPNPFVNPLNPFNNPFAINPLNPLNDPFMRNPLAVNPFVPVFPVNPVIGFAPQPPAHPPGTLAYQGPNTFVNNATGSVIQPIGGTTFADGTTFYRAPPITGFVNPNAAAFPRPAQNSPFTPYIW